MRTISILLAVALGMGGCGDPTDAYSTLGPNEVDSTDKGLPTMEEVGENGLPPLAKASSALVAPGCTYGQRKAAERGMNLLANALANAINAYAANPQNAGAMFSFGNRNWDQTLQVYYNLLWAYTTIVQDGTNYNISISCSDTSMCAPGNIAWSQTPLLTAVCQPNNDYFWLASPYIMAHEMFHWLGWPDWYNLPDTAETVSFWAQYDVATAIQYPHAYALYLYDFIAPLFTEPLVVEPLH